MKTIIQARKFIKEKLNAALENNDKVVRYLLEDLFKIFDETSERLLNEGEWSTLVKAVEQLKGGVPLQYVTGVAHFYGMRFSVDPSVLIPRPETEELVYEVSKELKTKVGSEISLLDIGTGSGCIAITLKKYFNFLDVVGMDVSINALKVASENMRNLGVEVRFVHDDILNPTNKVINEGKWHYIVSNPPYIQLEEKDKMDKHVIQNEPHDALFPKGVTPLEMYREILRYSFAHLYSEGKIYLELNEFLAGGIQEIAVDEGFLDIEMIMDMQGKLRILFARKPAM